MYEEIARYYALTHAALRADVALVQALAQGAAGEVLELGCGNGRLLIPLSAITAVHGVDSSPAMLALARQAVAQLPAAQQQRITLTEADMTQLALPAENGRFALAIIPTNTLMHLAPPQISQTLRRIKPLLRENGRLFIDIVNPFVVAATDDSPEPELEQTFVDPDTGRPVQQLASYRLDDERQTLFVAWQFETVDENGRLQRVTSTMPYHYQYPHQLIMLLENAGYELQQLWGDYDRRDFAEDSERLLLLAQAT